MLNPCRELEKQGFEVVYVKPDNSGRLPPDALAAAIDQNTILVSCMLVNNETGAIFPVEEPPGHPPQPRPRPFSTWTLCRPLASCPSP